jgi:hypothetical protein
MIQPFISTSDRIELSNFKLNRAGYIITVSLMYLTIFIPVVVTTLILSTGGRPSFGLLISCAIFGFIAYFFYRLATWNKYGKEHFILENGLLIYKPEAKKVSYKTIEFKIENLVVSIINSEDAVEYNRTKENIAWLRLNDGQNSIETNIKTPQSIIINIVHIFEKWGINNDTLLEEIKD